MSQRLGIGAALLGDPEGIRWVTHWSAAVKPGSTGPGIPRPLPIDGSRVMPVSVRYERWLVVPREAAW
jgi:hypothetical protein